jgi:hypothetical protein
MISAPLGDGRKGEEKEDGEAQDGGKKEVVLQNHQRFYEV